MILNLFIVTYSAACNTRSTAFFKSMKPCYRFCWWCAYFSNSSHRLDICSPALLPAQNYSCSSAIIASVCGLFMMTFIIIMLG